MKRLGLYLISIALAAALLCAPLLPAIITCVSRQPSPTQVIMQAEPAYDAASPRYARAKVRDAYFFTEKNSSSSLFAVPYTYCIKVIGEEGDWLRAVYAADSGIYREITGFCRSQDFEMLDGVPEVTYLYKTVTVKYTAGGGSGSLPVLNEISIEAAYYGTYYSGATVYSYVYCQGAFGYIEGANDDYPLIGSTGENLSGEGEGDDNNGVGWSAGLICAIVILILFAAVIVALHFITRKKHTE